MNCSSSLVAKWRVAVHFVNIDPEKLLGVENGSETREVRQKHTKTRISSRRVGDWILEFANLLHVHDPTRGTMVVVLSHNWNNHVHNYPIFGCLASNKSKFPCFQLWLPPAVYCTRTSCSFSSKIMCTCESWRERAAVNPLHEPGSTSEVTNVRNKKHIRDQVPLRCSTKVPPYSGWTNEVFHTW